MKPATRFLIAGASIVIVLTIAAAVGVVWQTRSAAQQRSLQQLQVTSSVENDLQANRQQELQLRAEALARDPAFVDYVAQSLIPNPQLGGAVDSVSISDLLKDRRKGYDVAVVLDPRGKVIATSGVLLKDPASVQRDALVQQAVSTQMPVQGAWVDHGQLLWVTINPLMRGRTLQGLLIAATGMDKAFAIAVSRISRSDVAFVLPPSAGAVAPAAGIDGWVAQALAKQTPSLLALEKKQAVLLADGSKRTTVWVTPLTIVGGSAAMVAVDPAATSMGLIEPSARPLLAIVLGLGVIGLLLVLLLWWRTWMPLQRMIELIARAAHTGDQNLTTPAEGSHLVRRMREAVNPLLHRIARRDGDRSSQRSARKSEEFSRTSDP